MEEQELSIKREDNEYNRHNFQIDGNNIDLSINNHHKKSSNLESQMMKESFSKSSLKDLCRLLLSSFCGILDEFGLETQADEEMLLMAIDSEDFDSVIEYVKLFRNKISSILILNNIVKDFKTDMEIGMTTVPEIINDIENMQDSEYDQISETERNSIEQVINYNDKDIIEDDLTNIDSNDFQKRIDLNNPELGNLKILSPNTNINSSNHIKKSPVPPLNVEKAGPGSWNRGQLPDEYPIE
ncbi:uncharacterized protein cubi_01730 [Cryptosporidium ubiquitum]|uniref:Uncharacterized protein n=1 Tax=Cryptosporidium ubiquitum TaxID=857276 RepID=A0A1J4MB93_9CRYT|nr:uncharacterized protein cubi_01730 [Cryptosporidium ubiquitum]OII71255.1 hypothetical protein cubi_01730 [Cryptosporidium ubiquitum]